MKFTVKHNFPEVQRQLDQLREDVARRALSSAVNKTLAQAKTRMIRAITAEFNIKAGAVRESLRVSNASARFGSYAITGFLESPSKRGRSRNLIHFGAKQTPQGVSVKIKRDGPRKVIRGAFIALKDNQYGGTVFIRKGKARLPIEAKQTIDVAQMFNTKRINAAVVAMMKDKFPQVFANEAKFYLDRFNGQRASA